MDRATISVDHAERDADSASQTTRGSTIERGRQYGRFHCWGADVRRIATPGTWMSAHGLAVFIETVVVRARLEGRSVDHLPASVLHELELHANASYEMDKDKADKLANGLKNSLDRVSTHKFKIGSTDELKGLYAA